MFGPGRVVQVGPNKFVEEVDGHWYIDGTNGYGADQRICIDTPNGLCRGVPNQESTIPGLEQV